MLWSLRELTDCSLKASHVVIENPLLSRRMGSCQLSFYRQPFAISEFDSPLEFSPLFQKADAVLRGWMCRVERRLPHQPYATKAFKLSLRHNRDLMR